MNTHLLLYRISKIGRPSVLLLALTFIFLHSFAQPALEDAAGGSYVASGDESDITVWSSGEITQSCSGDFTIEFVTGGSGTAQFQYSLDGVGGWTTIVSGATIGSFPSVFLRYYAATLADLENVVVSDILVYEPFTVALAGSSNITCNGDDDGAIDITVSCGSQSGPFTYSWSGPGSFSSSDEDLTGLEPGDYSCIVSNGVDPDVSIGPITIAEPTAISVLVLTPNLLSCPNPGENGEIGFTVSGGTTPYADTTVWSSSLRSSGYAEYTGELNVLPGDFYYGIITDANGCTFTTDTVEVVEDVADPVLTAFPYDYHEDYAIFSARASTPENIDVGFVPYAYSGTSPTNDTVTFTIDATNYSTLEFSLTASQAAVNWDNVDYLEVQVDYTGSGTFNSVLKDFCEWNAVNDPGEGDGTAVTTTSIGTGYIDISSALGSPAAQIRIIAFADDFSKVYNIENFTIRGKNLTSVISTGTSGAPGCSDPDGNTCSVSSEVSDIVWNCTTPGDLEFYYTRTWKATDGCGKESAPQVQRIRVGTAPVFDVAPADTILDYCRYNFDNDIDAPSVTEGPCGGAYSVSWTVARENPLFDGNDTIAQGAGATVSGITYPMPTVNADSVYVIHWLLVDDAFIENTYTQTVSIRKAITISLLPYRDFCEGEEVSFSVSVSGGSGVFGAPTITPVESQPWNSTGNGSGTYTTNLLDLSNVPASSTITVSYVDLDDVSVVIGGCDSGDIIFTDGVDFDVHDLISTPDISRD